MFCVIAVVSYVGRVHYQLHILTYCKMLYCKRPEYEPSVP